MRRGWAIALTILAVLAVLGIAVGAYNAGIDEGVRRGAEAGQVIEVIGSRSGHRGVLFFPFGLILFPLFIFGVAWLIGSAFRGGRGRWAHDHGRGGFGPWSDEGRSRFEERAQEWHQRQHEATAGGDEGGSGPPAT